MALSARAARVEERNEAYLRSNRDVIMAKKAQQEQFAREKEERVRARTAATTRAVWPSGISESVL